jgi:hypothetical protein
MHKLHHIGSSHCKLNKGFHWNNPTTIICTVGSKDFPMIFIFLYSQWTCLYSCALYMGRLNKLSHFNDIKCIVHTCNCTYTLKCLHIFHLFKLSKFPSTTQHCPSSHHLVTQKSKKFSNNFYFVLLFTYFVMLAWFKRFC